VSERVFMLFCHCLFDSRLEPQGSPMVRFCVCDCFCQPLIKVSAFQPQGYMCVWWCVLTSKKLDFDTHTTSCEHAYACAYSHTFMHTQSHAYTYTLSLIHTTIHTYIPGVGKQIP